MGFLDKVKDATGIGLNGVAQYRRAYEKGVFLQPPDYDSASKHFAAAAEKLSKEGDSAMALRAQTNALLYRLIHARQLDLISQVIQGLEGLQEIEHFASQTEMMPSALLASELKAIRAELEAEQSTDFASKAFAYQCASDHVMQLGSAALMLTERLRMQGPADKAMSRGFYYAALADYNSAFKALASSPEEAQDNFHKAAAGFRQAQTREWADRTDAHIADVKTRRHCWICHREVHGRDHYFRYYSASVTDYHRTLVEQMNHDVGMLDRPDSVTLCSVCGSAIERQADRYATERAEAVRRAVMTILDAQASAITQLHARVTQLERMAHTH